VVFLGGVGVLAVNRCSGVREFIVERQRNVINTPRAEHLVSIIKVKRETPSGASKWQPLPPKSFEMQARRSCDRGGLEFLQYVRSDHFPRRFWRRSANVPTSEKATASLDAVNIQQEICSLYKKTVKCQSQSYLIGDFMS
jgi:hypothetical protein